MKVEKIEVDSEVFGHNVLLLKDVEPGDNVAEAEAQYLAEFCPVYVSCRLPMEDLGTIHRLEQHGFHLIECQIKAAIHFRQDFDVGRFPYVYERVATREALDSVLTIAERTVVHDRFSVDAAVPRGISGERYRRYVQKSFARPDEAVWRLYDPAGMTTLAFRTHRRTAPREVLLLLGGVHPDLKALGLGVISSHFCFRQMRQDGIRKAITHISASNYPVFNLEIGHLGFRALGTFAVMRKIYERRSDEPIIYDPSALARRLN
jgi:hypothetical protein